LFLFTINKWKSEQFNVSLSLAQGIAHSSMNTGL